MYADHSPGYSNVAPACYFSIVVPTSYAHFSTETPDITPVSDYSPQTFSDPTNPLLAFRPTPIEFMSSPPDASRLLQLQTAAAHRPSAGPLQSSASSSTANSTDSSSSTSSNNSRSSSTSSRSSPMSPTQLCCCRCRRESLMGMIQFSTNIYYCSHCARMVGYSAG